MGKSKVLASRDGAREITFAALAATIAVVAIFLPVAFMSGIIGRFFFQFGITISAAVLLSLVEAITVTPMRCSQFMGDTRTRLRALGGGQFEKIGAFIGACCVLPRSPLAGHFRLHRDLCLARSRYGNLLPKEFLPRQDQSAFLIRVQTPVKLVHHLHGRQAGRGGKNPEARIPEIDHFFSSIGGFTSDTAAPTAR